MKKQTKIAIIMGCIYAAACFVLLVSESAILRAVAILAGYVVILFFIFYFF